MGTRDKPVIGVKGPDVSSKNTCYTSRPIKPIKKRYVIYFLFVTVVKRNGQLVKLEFYQSVVRSFVYHSSRR